MEGFTLDKAAADALLRSPMVLDAVKTQFGDAILADARTIVPVDTGQLRDSGYSEVQDDRVQVGYEAEHSIYNELGTERMPARPFLRPSAFKYRG
jgi:HK97 gp10 family phage protein